MSQTIADTITTVIKREIRKINTAVPGTIETYDNVTRKASVNIDINITLEDGTILESPIITNVPVVFQSSSGVSITFPLKRGDGVLLIFSQNSLERWCNTAGEVAETDPRKFAISDGIAIPGLFDFKTVTEGSAEGLKINSDESINLESTNDTEIDAANIYLNGSSKPFVTHAELDAALQTFITALNLHTHPTAPTGPVSPPTVPMSINISASATTTVKTGG